MKKKYFEITNLIFELPEDFEGSITDILEEIIKYRKSENAKKNRKYTDIKPDDYKGAYDDLKENTKAKLSFGYKILELGEDNSVIDIKDKYPID